MFQISVATYCSDEEGRRLIRKRAEEYFDREVYSLELALRQFVADNPRVPFDEAEIASNEYGDLVVRRKYKRSRKRKAGSP